MASLMKREIKRTFMELLEQRPFSQITVKDIVEACGINRNTFYYHFTDLPDLVEAVMKEEADRIMRGYRGISSLEECIDAAMQLCVDHKRALLHIFNSANRDIYERYLLEICEYVSTALVNNLTEGMAVPEEDKRAVIQGYKCECFGYIVNWLNHGMSQELRRQFLRLCELRMGMTEELLRRSMA